MKNKELIKNVPSSEKVLEWNAKETVAGAEQKANEAFEKAKTYADENKVQKEEGKGLSSQDFTKEEKDKLATLQNYVHPEKHTTTDITTNSDARFVSDAQILEWDKKETVDGAQGKADRALADSKAYTDQETDRLDNSKIDFVELQNKEILFKANQLEKFRITLPSALDKIPIATVSEIGGIKVGAGLTITEDGILNATGGGVADSVAWENIVGIPERFTPMEHIHEVATTDKDGFLSKADKVKLDGLTNYTHPDYHAATMITEDASHKFVTEEQIATFGDKYTKVETNNLLKRKFDNVEFSGGTLRFYADSVKKFDIEIPAADFNTMLNKPNTFNPPIASNKILGGIKVGSGLSILEDGTLNANVESLDWEKIAKKPDSFTPPIASNNTLGGIKVGSDFSITDDGTLSLNSSSTHSHSNIDSLNKINENKLSEWDSKETSTGAQEKATKALNDSKKYTDSKMLKTKRMVINLFNYDEASRFYKATALHGLNTESVFIMAFDSATKESEILSYKIIDKNTIEVATVKEVNSIDLYIIGGEFMTSIENVIINDSATSLESTWSSQKINEELQKYSSLSTQYETLSGKVTQVESSVGSLPGQITSVSEKLDGVDLEVKSLKEKEQQNQSTFTLLRSDVDKKVATEDLSRSGGCRIHGENIRTGTLSVDLLKSNNENPIIRLFDQCALDATASMNQGKGSAIRLKWDDSNYIYVSSSETAFFNHGQKTMSFGTNSQPIIRLFGNGSIDATAYGETGVGNAIRFKWDRNNYLSVTDGEARFYINGTNVVKIGSSGIIQGLSTTSNALPVSYNKEQTKFSEFVANEFGNAIVLDENNKLAIDTTKITTPEMKELLAEEDGSYSYSGCIAVLTMALKEEIQARKALEAKMNQ